MRVGSSTPLQRVGGRVQLGARRVLRPLRHHHAVCANPESKTDKTTTDKRLQLVEQAKERMKKRGIDKVRVCQTLATCNLTAPGQATARQILRVWRDKGVDGDPQQLRKLLVDNSMRNVTKVVVQLVFDAVASGWSFFSASQVAQAPEMGWVQFPLELVLTFVGFYFAIGALLNVTTLGAVAAAAAQYRNNAEELLIAMEELAQAPSSASNLLQTAGQAVDMLRVVQALNEISDLLKAQLGDGKVDTADLFRDLSAYLTLERAEKQGGFQAAAYGLTDQQAADVAVVFNQYDTNQDGKLDVPEMQRLCEATFKEPLSLDEIKAGVGLLDTNQDGAIQFDEFVSWWVKRVELPAA